MKQFLARIGLVAATALVIAGCGGGAVTGTQASKSTAAPTVTVSEKELVIEPKTIELSQGTTHLLIKNVGQLPHDFYIDDLGVKVGSIQPGKSAEVDVKADKAGTYQAYCNQPGHKEAGMVASVVVK